MATHKAPIEGVIKEEYERQKRLSELYIKKISKLPKGSISYQSRQNNVYAYLKYKNGKKVVNQYLGPKGADMIDDTQKQIEKRKKIEAQLEEVKKNIRRMEKLLHAK